MRIITGDTTSSSGDVWVGGHSVRGDRDRARRHLGYCPQFDALPDKLTTRETLALYARIRGVPAAELQDNVEATIARMCLSAHQHSTCERLSGGNKRKLSTALALIGEPDVVLLDEPSTGIDVGARRFLWDLLGDIRKRGHALVITSHSMEECEVLCTRLTIMVDGQFRCLGSPLQLKSKHGKGYMLTLKAQPHGADDKAELPVATIREFIATRFPTAKLVEDNVGLLRYHLVGADGREQEVPLADIFQALEGCTAEGGKLKDCISDYTLSQTSLEEVFLRFCES
eukprot:gnl/TRDRNA2_/TRDRNA2_149525_c3_seq1.p1 gnl/TRDRNA2_/TRDRNA2_149525_c3~~gnl/TRDRNA2_/TRDRNA2_149525_c3_seq1.p1  ORF type:complete len:316 (-),score=67.37 gnl/TRDRNA2_/TRDRNA2_149525_c3_seq1:51-905(-)